MSQTPAQSAMPPLPEGREPMPTLSLWQPYASLWAGGPKSTETRSWNHHQRPALTYRRGFRLPCWFAVHATVKFDRECQSTCLVEPFKSALASLGYTKVGDLPVGKVVGIVYVERTYRFGPHVPLPPQPDRSFGNFEAGRYGWVRSWHRLLAEPIPASGSQGVWGWAPPVPWAQLRFAERVTAEAMAVSVLAEREAEQNAAAAARAAEEAERRAQDPQGMLF